MESLFIGYNNGLVRASVNGEVDASWVLEGAPVPMVAADPERPERIYAATLGNGLCRSEDGGRNFERLAGLDRDLVWSVATSPSDRHDGFATIYVGTQMSALYRSVDGGDSFEEIASVQDLPERSAWAFPPAPDTHHVHQIILDIEDPATVVFGVELGGVYCTRDSGQTWTRTNADPDPHTLRTHPRAPARMYEGGGAAYYASRDGGGSWERNLEGIPDEVRYFYSLAVDAGDPENVLLVGARDPFGGHAVIPGVPVWSSVFRLRDGTWQAVTEGLPAPEGNAMGTLAAGGPGVFFYVTDSGDVHRSEDGGTTFALLPDGATSVHGAGARSVLVLDR